eukprot:TRINITY_DN5439_c0_g1_i7.p1 TRINITY_DN5439_c0_g1~~TRINITY_DN5439_c0_g1_i7.p1  ORF type:complete len:652 (-),score=109.70 TRINITY_DN5439_c0_g1_i7:176-2131(-)
MYLNGYSVAFCLKVASASFTGQLPSYAGPCAGISIMLVGAAIVVIKRSCATSTEKMGEVSQVLARLGNLDSDGIRIDGFALAKVTVLTFEPERFRLVQSTPVSVISDKLKEVSTSGGCFGNEYDDLQVHLTCKAASGQEQRFENKDYEWWKKTADKSNEERKKQGKKPEDKPNEIWIEAAERLTIESAEVSAMREAGSEDFIGSPSELKSALSKELEHARYVMVFRPQAKVKVVEAQGTVDKKESSPIRKWLEGVVTRVKAMIPVTDNYSDMAQSITFLRVGQPFFALYNIVGILWNVIIGVNSNMPRLDGGWLAFEMFGRFFQADVLEAASQAIETGKETEFLFKKVCIAASTESITNTLIVLYAILIMEGCETDGLDIIPVPAWASPQLWNFFIDFCIINGSAGLFSNLLLSFQSLYHGIGIAPQWVQILSGGNANGLQEPNQTIALLRVSEALSLMIVATVLAVCTRKFGAVYAILAIVLLLSHMPRAADKIDVDIEHRKLAPSEAPSERQKQLTMEAFKCIAWPVFPPSFVWPWEMPFDIESKSCLWFSSCRFLACASTWAWLLTGGRAALFQEIPLPELPEMFRNISLQELPKLVRIFLAMLGMLSTLCIPVSLVCLKIWPVAKTYRRVAPEDPEDKSYSVLTHND